MIEMLTLARAHGFRLSIAVTSTTLGYTLATSDEISGGIRDIAPGSTPSKVWPSLEQQIREHIAAAIAKAASALTKGS